ncbi:MAG: hypothetical protein IPM67_13980 [Sphingomonadales bacterium]|jgi:tetratricopeptide (TPR) repeat protein|nr:hypothetical protein [Sphingomonadales bacterium]MBK9269732.1 hypothetical protein [Sphingomonadales bacterium]MBP6434431.1 hypothetical protein [Sphingorhabdus sp.]
MVFARFFGGANGNREEGQKLFEEGMRHASNFDCLKAIDCYTRSIAASPNPAPYINRANLLSKRLRYREALSDLSEALRLDRRQSNEFAQVLDVEISKAEIVCDNYHNGMRQKLLADYREKKGAHGGVLGIARRILCSSFGITSSQWDYKTFNRPLIEFHFFNDLDNIAKFEEVELYPEVEEYLDLYPKSFINIKVDNCPDDKAYLKSEILLHSFLCCYDPDDMRHLRRIMLYDIHSHLLAIDFGDLYDSLLSECKGVIREAEIFLD